MGGEERQLKSDGKIHTHTHTQYWHTYMLVGFVKHVFSSCKQVLLNMGPSGDNLFQAGQQKHRVSAQK